MANPFFDVLIYGPHPGGIMAGCAAAHRGAKVGIFHHASHPGSPYSTGLGNTDTSNPGARAFGSYLTRNFFNRITAASGGTTFLLRQVPWLTEVTFGQMLRYYGVYTFFGPQYRAASVSKTGARTDSVTFDSGDTVNFTVGCDASDELDLLALAGCTLTRGRESAAQYNESLGGFFPAPWTFTAADTGDGLGGLINGYSPYPDLQPGDADLTQQVIGWRMALTDQAYNRRLVAKPPDYDESLILRQIRDIPTGNPNWKPWGIANTNFGRGDMNDDTSFGYMDGWGDAELVGRQGMFKKSYTEKASIMWYMQSSPNVDPSIRAAARALSLCNDEFQDTTASSSIYGATQRGWPYHFYLRDSRRLVGQYVMKQADCQTSPTKTDSLGPGQYSLDNHNHRLIAITQGGVKGYIKDSFGNVQDKSLRATSPGYHMPARSARPLASESTNLATINPSASAVAWSSLRIDVNRMVFGEAVGRWLAKAAMEAKQLDDVSIPDLQTELIGLGHPVTL